MRPLTRAAAGLLATGSGVLAYSLLEAHRYRLRHRSVPVLAPGRPDLRLLHVSDLHLTARHQGRVAWVRALAGLRPDAIVVTGDFLAHDDAVPHVLAALEPLLGLPGAFVLGSNDYYAPTFAAPWRYLAGPSTLPDRVRELPWKDLVRELTDAGWLDLSNARGRLTAGGLDLDVRGVDDPHIDRDAYAAVAGPFDESADLALGVVHAPYRRVLDPMSGDGAGLILAGHTHGGQVCVPGYGAIVTNCDLPPAAASGVSRHARPATCGTPGLGGVDGRGTFLHVSAGLGTSPYAPVRLACPPEATLLTLIARAA